MGVTKHKSRLISIIYAFNLKRILNTLVAETKQYPKMRTLIMRCLYIISVMKLFFIKSHKKKMKKKMVIPLKKY